jgi:hypothetical protein
MIRESDHFKKRCQQRGYRKRDINLIMEVAGLCRDGAFLTKKTVAQAIEQRKSEIQSLERLNGTMLVLDERFRIGVTAYRPSKRKIRFQNFR